MRLALRRKGSRRAAPPRRVSVAQYRRRRLAAALIGLVLFVGLGLTGRILLYDLGLADVREVRVTGTAMVPVRDVLGAAGVTPGGPLAAVDLTGIAHRVARLPAVESVRVGRSWPHSVAVDVTERVPVAVTRDGPGAQLVDRSGVVYPGAAVPGLPTLTAPAAGTDDPATLAAVAVLAALPEPVRGRGADRRGERSGRGRTDARPPRSSRRSPSGLTEDRADPLGLGRAGCREGRRVAAAAQPERPPLRRQQPGATDHPPLRPAPNPRSSTWSGPCGRAARLLDPVRIAT